MAYGVKYRLIFSDVLGNGKKVEISQDGYTGEVLPMIGTGNPVHIEWDADDNFYEPIIGSVCKINLLVTDDVSYEDFYKGDEREYRVKVFYDRGTTDSFQDRVEAITTNAGRIESPDCVSDVLTQNNTISTDFTKRVLNDGGTIDNETCIGKSITDSKTYDWQVYWDGFLYADGFKEVLSTTPYEINLEALDGLGLLEIEDSFVSIFPEPTVNDLFGEWFHVATILQNLNENILTNTERYLYWAGDIQRSGSESYDYMGVRPWHAECNIDSNRDFKSAKEVLEFILKQSNSRIFHAFGDWYVVPNSRYLDDVFKNQYHDRSVMQNALKNGQNEMIDFQVFSVGNTREFAGNSNKNVTKRIKQDLIPIDNDLVVEYLPPYGKVVIETDGQDFANFKNRVNVNRGFTYGSTEYRLFYGSVSSANSYAASNTQSYKLTNFTTTPNSYTNALWSEDDFIFRRKGSEENMQYEFQYLVENTNVNINTTLFYDIRVDMYFGSTETSRNYNAETNEWQSALVYNEIELTEADDYNTWVKISGTLPKLILSYVRSYALQLRVYFPLLENGTSGYQALYIDNVIFKDESTEYPDDLILNATTATNSGVFKTETLPNEQFVNFSLGNQQTDLDRTNKAQDIINDYRKFVPRYEGSVRESKKKPSTPYNKVFVDFGDEFREEQSSMIDGMKYSVKNSRIELIAHTSNNDPDVSVTFTEKNK